MRPKPRLGDLSGEEESQLDAYLFVGGMVDLMHSKARLSLERHAAGSNG